MKLASGPRPFAIRLFAVICTLAACVSLLRGLLDPFEAQGTLWGYTGMMLDEDGVIVALFSLFTISLIPIFWIYFVAGRFARWIVVCFALVGLWLYLLNPVYIVTAMRNDPFGLAAPLLKIVSVALLFTSSANEYFARRRERANVEGAQ